MTIGVGMANGEMKPYIEKGTKLPARKSMDHYTTVPLRSGYEEDLLHIPLLEGEHPRATRNHGIGELPIRGSDIRRDLPSGSQIEITVIMDKSQQIRLQAYVNSLDEDFEISFDPQMKHKSIDELRKESQQEKVRLATTRKKAEGTDSLRAEEALSRIDDEQLIDHIDSLIEASEDDPDAVAQLDRRLRQFAAAVDELEDSIEWPELIEKAEEALLEAQKVVEQYGKTSDRKRLNTLRSEHQRVIETGDADLLQRHIDSLDGLYLDVLNRQPGFHVGRFDWLVGRLQSMEDPGRAEEIIKKGRVAINNNDIHALKAANRQLLSLLPREVQEKAKDSRIGGTITRD
jgi:molecular chaperone DnaK